MPNDHSRSGRDVRRFRALMGVVIVGLIVSGVTAFPLLWEVVACLKTMYQPQ